MTPGHISIAIIGGGLGGLCSAIGLLKHPHIDVDVYEAAPSFSEISAGFALDDNTQKALARIGPHVVKALELAGAVNHKPTVRMIRGRGPNEGKTIYDIDKSGSSISFSRARFLEQLVKLVPDHLKHTNKRFVRAENSGPREQTTVYFADGTSICVDAVIGADGVRSKTREHVLGSQHPATHAEYVFAVTYRAAAPMEEALKKVDPALMNVNTKYWVIGDGGYVLWDQIDHDKAVDLVAVELRHEWKHEKWMIPADRQLLEEIYSDWGPTARGIVDVSVFGVSRRPRANDNHS